MYSKVSSFFLLCGISVFLSFGVDTENHSLEVYKVRGTQLRQKRLQTVKKEQELKVRVEQAEKPFDKKGKRNRFFTFLRRAIKCFLEIVVIPTALVSVLLFVTVSTVNLFPPLVSFATYHPYVGLYLPAWLGATAIYYAVGKPAFIIPLGLLL